MSIFTPSPGVKIAHTKRTGSLRPVRIHECCETVTLLMKQHTGAACVPCVKPGDRVDRGQVVGDTETDLAAPVHASVSGMVRRVESRRLPSGEDVRAVVIESDGEMRPFPGLAPPRVESAAEFFAAVRRSGLVGLGGGGFPAHAKLRSAAGKAEILLVNGAECEPCVTADHREMLDAAPDVIEGIRHICRWLGIPKAIIGIERNKPDAIALLKTLCARESTSELALEVHAVPSRYPQGSNKQLSYSLTGRVVPLGGRLTEAGLVMSNVTSTAFLGRYMRTGIPLISRTVTVEGGAVRTPSNVRVPLGIGLRELADFCGGLTSAPVRIVLGGPMMGAAHPGLDTPICKCDNALLLLTKEEAELPPETACIRCGACVNACPMRLPPCELEAAYRAGDAALLEKRDVAACLECGCCAYVCPAKRDLVTRIRLGKDLVKDEIEKRKGAAKA